MCYLPPAPALWMCLGALVGQGATFTASNAAHWSWVVRSPSARTHSCSGSLASLLVYWDSRSSANRNNGCSRGRPLRQADHRIQIALKSAPRAMGKTLVSAPSARIRLGRLATAVQTQDALPVARLVVPNTISFPWLQGKQLGQPPDFSMISPPELQPATTMTLEIDPQVRYQQNPSEAAQHAAVRAMVGLRRCGCELGGGDGQDKPFGKPKGPR
jgi:hypothetical protein